MLLFFEKKFPFFEPEFPFAAYMIMKAKKTLKENQVINFTSDFSSIVIATKTDITVDLDIHFTLNYRDTDRTLSPVSGEHHSSTSAYLVSEVKASPFSTELTVTADTNGQSFYSVYGMDANGESLTFYSLMEFAS